MRMASAGSRCEHARVAVLPRRLASRGTASSPNWRSSNAVRGGFTTEPLRSFENLIFLQKFDFGDVQFLVLTLERAG